MYYLRAGFIRVSMPSKKEIIQKQLCACRRQLNMLLGSKLYSQSIQRSGSCDNEKCRTKGKQTTLTVECLACEGRYCNFPCTREDHPYEKCTVDDESQSDSESQYIRTLPGNDDVCSVCNREQILQYECTLCNREYCSSDHMYSHYPNNQCPRSN